MPLLLVATLRQGQVVQGWATELLRSVPSEEPVDNEKDCDAGVSSDTVTPGSDSGSSE